MVQQTKNPRKKGAKRGGRPKPETKRTIQSDLVERLPDVSPEDKKQSAVAIPLELLDNRLTGINDPDCRWETQEEVDAALTSQREDGNLQNITVTPLPGGRYWIEHGRHRTLLAELTGQVKIFAVIQYNWNRKQATIAAVAENESRTADSAYHAGKQYQMALDAGNSLAAIVSRTRYSKGTVQNRLAIHRLGPKLGPVFAARLTHEYLPHVRDIAKNEDLAADLAAYITKLELIHGGNWLIRNWARASENLCVPLDHGFIDEATGQHDYYIKQHIAEDPEYLKAIEALPHVKVGPKDSPMVVCLDPESATKAVAEAEARRKEAEKNSANTAKRSGKSAEQIRTERIEKRCRTTGLDFLARHLNSRAFFGDAMQKLALKRMLKGVGVVASAKVDQQALADVLGEFAPEDIKALERGRPEYVDELFDEHHVVLMRYVGAVVFLSERNHHHYGGPPHLVSDDEVSRLLTGKTAGQLKGLATRAVDADLAKKGDATGKSKGKGGKAKSGSKAGKKRPPKKEPTMAPAEAPASGENGLDESAEGGEAKVPVRPGGEGLEQEPEQPATVEGGASDQEAAPETGPQPTPSAEDPSPSVQTVVEEPVPA